MPTLSSWQVNQWAEIERHSAYRIVCRLCNWSFRGYMERKEAENIFRDHWDNRHKEEVKSVPSLENPR